MTKVSKNVRPNVNETGNKSFFGSFLPDECRQLAFPFL